MTADEERKRMERLQRFQNNASTSNIPAPIPSMRKGDAVVGTSTEVLKDYLRLTSEVDPRNVRPYLILKQALKQVTNRYKDGAEYPWVCSQMKSIRQDLMVQHIANKFSVKVYEYHARIALEKSDMGEFNQCQSQLKILYAKGIHGHEEEFLAYRLLYFIFSQHRSDMALVLGEIKSSAYKSSPGVQHALAVHHALETGNYHVFFILYQDAPNMNGYLLDQFVNRERIKALCIICKAYQAGIPVTFVATELGFDDVRLFKRFLKVYHITKRSYENGILQCKAVLPMLTTAMAKFNQVDIRGQL
ncbi:hypothetical protein DM01DRAFT_1360897 [Hesseltinella vesiculosa]|uniref:SAC3/GANP/THP3 conserved domain-containing protein n=1 Tax=Hesseltinella vesiculosa TaxID=101127 RepID=A0A1X2GY45_9FUNG|nr:hypothetical protein DM01DRAFT_1360897 [Hesseltinella vesiculosa]